MKLSRSLLIVFLAALLMSVLVPIAPAVGQTKKDARPAETKMQQGASYVCPKHPESTSEKPGKCPTCGMNLVLREEKGKAMHDNQASENSTADEVA